MNIDCRFFLDSPASGVRNMAVDEALLLNAAENGAATLRFYHWEVPTLSLGYFQRYADREQHEASLNCPVVRRQTGGGAILHDRELTYSLALPPRHPWTRQNERLYQIVHEVFVKALSADNSPIEGEGHLHIRSLGAGLQPNEEPFMCFQRKSPGDVIFIEQEKDCTVGAGSLATPPIPKGTKVLGSAQRRYRGAVLQHGSLLWERSPAAPELEGLYDLKPQIAEESHVIYAVAAELATTLGLQLLEEKLSPDLELIVEQIANNKYGSPTWTKRR